MPERRLSLAECRRRAGLTQRQVAQKLGVSQARVSDIETTDIRYLQIATIVRYTEAIGARLTIVAIDLEGGSAEVVM
jgi:transcriptional regulator with XRE-family HTH domain